MRVHTGWTLGTLASAVLLAGLASRALAQAPAAATKPAAVVNGEAISWADLEQAVLMLQKGPSPVELTESKKREIRFQALSFLLDDLLLKQFLRQNAPRVEQAEVDKRMAELAAIQQKEGKTLADFYRETYQTEAMVRGNTTYMLMWQAYVKARLTEADLKRYYDDNKDYFDGVRVQASHIVLRVAPEAPEGEWQAARTKLLAIRQEIVSGKIDFAEAARKHSQCATAAQGGDLGDEFERKLSWVDEPFAKAAFALKVGEVSDAVRTDFGLHLIKVTKRTPPTPSEYAKVKDTVEMLCELELRMSIIQHMRKTARIETGLQ
jgi:peptidyl-prolyl cis-trans isomerase C